MQLDGLKISDRMRGKGVAALVVKLVKMRFRMVVEVLLFDLKVLVFGISVAGEQSKFQKQHLRFQVALYARVQLQLN